MDSSLNEASVRLDIMHSFNQPSSRTGLLAGHRTRRAFGENLSQELNSRDGSSCFTGPCGWLEGPRSSEPLTCSSEL